MLLTRIGEPKSALRILQIPWQQNAEPTMAATISTKVMRTVTIYNPRAT